MDLNLIAPCGIDCVNCEMFAANGRKDVWERAAAKLGKQPEQIACPGCRANHGCTVHAACPTVACMEEKGIDFCYECAEFPCRRLMPMADGASFYPHNMKIYNLNRIKLLGPEAFLAETKHNRLLYYKGKFALGAGPQEPV